MAKSKTPPEPKTAEQVAKTPALLAARLKGKVVRIGDVEFHIRALPSLVVYYLNAASMVKDKLNRGVYLYGVMRFGTEKIVGLLDSDGNPDGGEFETVEIDGELYPALTRGFVNRLYREIVGELAGEILELNELSFEEQDKLDFTTPSTGTSDQDAAGALTVITVNETPLSS